MTKSDHDEIRQLFAVYANAIDAKDYAAISACFTPDAIATYASYSDTLSGLAEIEAHMRRALDPLDASQHLFANFIITLEGDAVQVKCDILAQHVRQGQSYLAGGKYDVEVRRVAGIWKIAQLAARTIWSEGNRAMLPSVD
jgi:ketosteroid isomerase-like protein